MQSVTQPLADKLRPKNFDEVVGQEHLIGKDAPITKMLVQQHVTSIIFWGPPGTGKTTIAKLIAQKSNLSFESISAVFSGVAELRKVFDRAKQRQQMQQGTLLFVDEIHRFNRSQQDSFLPYVEDGTIVLIGATTENPSFELNSALLSRTQVLLVKRLNEKALEQLIQKTEAHYQQKLALTTQARELLITMADGDGRYLINLIEQLRLFDNKNEMNENQLMQVLQQRAPVYDKHQESHYNLISALHKSLRGSDCDAALYWLARMLVGGEDPNYIARRLVRFATEDVGLADPQALTHAMNAWQAYERIGSPEGELAIANCVIYLATAPKSNAAYTALKVAMKSAKNTGSLMPPKHILNAPTKLMKNIGYGKNYQYDHQTELGFSGQNYFPDDMPREQFYQPVDRGFEREINKRLAYWEKLRAKLNQY